MSRKIRVAGLSTFLAAALAATSTANAQWTVTTLHPEGAAWSSAEGVSGSQQVGRIDFGVRYRAALWSGSAGSWVDLNPPGSLDSFASGVSDGRQVGYVNVDGQPHAALWSGSADSWVDMNPTGAFFSYALCITGSQIGGQVQSEISSTAHAALWNGSTTSWVDLHPVDAVNGYSRVAGVSDAQQVGELLRQGSSDHAALWSGTAESFVDLNPPGASSSGALGVWGGQQVGYMTVGSGRHAVLWRGAAASWVDLAPEAFGSEALAAHDGIQVGYVDNHATAWYGSAALRTDLHAVLPAGFSYSTASAVWTDATHVYVVGAGFNETAGRREALMWVRPNCSADVDLGRQGGLPGPDGLLDNNDLIAFIDYFFAADAHADRGSAGGVPGADGLFDNNDFVVYIDQLFAGC